MKLRALAAVCLFAGRASADCQLGDFAPSTVLDCTFDTKTSVAATLSGSPVVSVYKGNSQTQTTTGVTLDVDFDGVTGFNHVRIDTSSDGTFYSAGGFFSIVVTTGTVGGASVVPATVGGFTLNATAALRPTTAGRALDVSAGGEAGIDWANVGSPTSANDLSATTIGNLTTNTDKTGYSLTQAFPSNFSALSITAGGLTDITQAAADKTWTTTSRTITGGTIGTYTGNTPQTGDAFARLGAPAGASMSADVAAMKLDTAAIKLKTDQFVFTTPNRVDASLVGGSAPTAEENAAASWAYAARTLTDKTGYSLTQAFPANFSALSITAGGLTDITQAAADKAWGTASRTLTACSFCLTATQTENAVWDAVLTGHVTAGTAGKKLTDIPTSSGGATAAQIWSYSPRTLTNISGTVIIVSPTGTEGRLTLTRNDSYYLAQGPIPTFTRTGWNNLTGATEVRLTVRRRPPVATGLDPVLLTVTDRAASRVFGAGSQTVAFELSTTNTAGLVPGTNTGKYDIQITYPDGHVYTAETGLVNVTEDQTRP